MKGLLVRVGIDQAYGRWNAPMDPVSRAFIYVPVPSNTPFHKGMDTSFSDLVPALEKFCLTRSVDLSTGLRFPADIARSHTHLDPDFDYLTYGDAPRRGAGLLELTEGDVVAFYAGLRPIGTHSQKLVYALIGLYVVDRVERPSEVPRQRWNENAHTRRLEPHPQDVIVRGRRGLSGRLERCVPIGEWRDRAYRVRREILRAWGGLSVKNGYIQRSAVPPSFLAPERFYEWFLAQKILLVARNW
jgi:hypothetical protein